MATPFTRIKTESTEADKATVLKAEEPVDQATALYEFKKIHKPGEGDYRALKLKAGALAATDAEKKSRTMHDQRFQMSGLMKESLSIEAEERRAIDERVATEVAKLAEQARTQGFEKGYAEGQAKGIEQATAEMRIQATDRLSKIQSLLEAFESVQQRVFEENESFLMEVVAQVSKRVILREIKTDSQYVLRLMKELIEKTGVRENIKILVSSDQYKELEKLQEGLQQTVGNLKNVSIEPSDRVQLGGVVFESQWNSIDATLESQLKNIEATLSGLTKVDSGVDP